MRAVPPFDVRLYRGALRLFPGGFREEYVSQIALDYDDARGEAASTGRAGDLVMFWLVMSRDLAGSIAAQWLRTGWPLIATGAVAVSWLQFSAVTSFWWESMLPTQSHGDVFDAVVLLMLIAVVLVVIAVTIVATAWIGRSMRRPRRR